MADGTLVFKPKKGTKGGTKTTDLKTVTKQIEAGERTVLRLKFEGSKFKRRKLTRRLKQTLRKGNEKVRLRAQVEFTDEAGNTATEKRVSRLKVKKKRK